jgi:hypothetical protein
MELCVAATSASGGIYVAVVQEPTDDRPGSATAHPAIPWAT